jgi:hypothetical protein
VTGTFFFFSFYNQQVHETLITRTS